MGKVKVDLKGLKDLKEKLEGIQEQIPQVIAELANEIAGRLLRGAIKNTPVGEKNGGTLRRGWTIGNIIETPQGYTVEIINPVEYAPYVEFGHRTRNHKGWVKGQFMFTIAKKDVQNNLHKIVENKIKKLLKGGSNG